MCSVLKTLAVPCPPAISPLCEVMNADLQGHLDMVAPMAVVAMAVRMAVLAMAVVGMAALTAALVMVTAIMGQAHMAAAVCTVAVQCMAGPRAVPCMAAVTVEATAVVMAASMGQVL